MEGPLRRRLRREPGRDPLSLPARTATASRGDLLRVPLAVGLTGAGVLTLLHVRDPHEPGSYGFCPFLLLTGHPCAGCGGMRAVNLLTDGDLAGAVSSNAFAVVFVAVAAVAWAVWLVRRARGVDAPFLTWGATTWTVVATMIMVFWVVRLTPWGAWLQP